MDLDRDDLVRRLQTSREYFAAVREAMHGSWHDWQSRYEQSASLPHRVVLVHPAWLSPNAMTPRRQSRTFALPAATYESCASQLLWGYDCPFEPVLHVDHLFPFAFGGPTTTSNGIYLCRDHNLAKGHDVHLHPWTPEYFAWLPGEIAAVQALVETN